MQSVDRTAKILAHTDTSLPKLDDASKLPSTDAEMNHYIEDPRTSLSGQFGKLSARLTFETRFDFSFFKRNATFAAFIRKEGYFFEKSELKSTRIKYIEFFDKKLPHGTRITFFTALLRKLVHISKPFQILSTLVKASDKSAVQMYAYLLVAAPSDEACILQEMKQFNAPHTNFYGWEKFKDDKQTTEVQREEILTKMNAYVDQNMSILFKGFQDNVLMRMTSKKKRGESAPAKTVGDPNQ